MNDELIHYGGINGATGRPTIPPLTIREYATAIRQLADPVNLWELQGRAARGRLQLLGLPDGINPCRLDATGWGIVFAEDADPAVEEALSELITHRQNQAGARFRNFRGDAGVRPGQTKKEWLDARGAGPVEVDPDIVPYYLLLVGSPEAIPFAFQSLLAVDYAVGRIHFDTLQKYADYARSVVLVEKRRRAFLPRRIAFYGAVNGVDTATNHMRHGLIDPVSKIIREKAAKDLTARGGLDDPEDPTRPCSNAAGLVDDWQVETYIERDATRQRLLGLLGDGGRAPALLFTGCHGYEPDNAARLPFEQGALVSSDWEGPGAPVPRDTFVSGEDVAGDMNLLGMIAFFFACYSGGTPKEADEFVRKLVRVPTLPANSFVANLPARMLAAPAGGALAVIAQVAPTFSISYQWPEVGKIHSPFVDCVTRLLRGFPIGHALVPFMDRFSSQETELAAWLRKTRRNSVIPDSKLIMPWLAGYISGNNIILGDPAVRLTPTTLNPNARLPAFRPRARADMDVPGQGVQ